MLISTELFQPITGRQGSVAFSNSLNKLCGRPPQYALQVDLLVSESRVMWATSVPILVFLNLSILDLGPMYAKDRQTSDAHDCLMPPTLLAGHNKVP